MSSPKIFESEYRFCLILWEHEPISSRELSELCKEKLGWSKTTTYTVIKRLSDRGVVKNENTIVRSLISKEEAQAAEIDELMEKKFEGSVPAFLAAFSRHKKLTEEEIAEIRRIIGE
ncbi:MAG: BlaI/MecI/CopY family transcriptional regulator [Christensenellaceae bacterium]|nr:BlaI/MecI/CopY family transcriptional regulator [Christensenellaceae bacterium]